MDKIEQLDRILIDYNLGNIKRHKAREKICLLFDVVCCDCKAPLDEKEQAENAKNKKDESVRCYYCYRDNAISNGEIGWL